MNILFLCTFYHRAMIFYDLIQNLLPLGYQVKVFNAVSKGSVISEKYCEIMNENVVHSECFQKIDRFFYFRKQKKIRDAILREIDFENCDLIHSHTFFNGGWAAHQIWRKYGIPYVVTVRNTDLNIFFHIPGFRRLAQIIARDASGIQFLSETYKKAFLQNYISKTNRNAVADKCAVIRNGVESFWIEHAGTPKAFQGNAIRLICVGKIDRNKNMETVVKVAKKLVQKGFDTRLTLIGQVVDPSIYRSLQKEKIVTMIPYQTKEALIQYYQNSDIFVMPSFNESFGRVYVEAMSQGLPVIYTRGQGFDGIFPDGDIGYAVGADNVEEIVTAVVKTLSNYEEVSKRCIGACERFDWRKIALQMDIFYQKAGVKTA